MRKTITIALILSFVLSSCAVIFKGTKEEVAFDSGPEGAEVWINGAKAGVTPCKIQLKSNTEYSIEFRKEGYKSRTYQLSNHVGGGWIVLDILGGLVPVIIDAATGAWYHLDQDSFNAALEKQQ